MAERKFRFGDPPNLIPFKSSAPFDEPRRAEIRGALQGVVPNELAKELVGYAHDAMNAHGLTMDQFVNAAKDVFKPQKTESLDDLPPAA